jgi:LuxR family maltose regulon positive regulatory protein
VNDLHVESQLPPVRIERPRPRARLEALLHAHRTVVLATPAGYGKTTLGRDVASGWGGVVVWLDADDEHADAGRLVADLVAAVQRVDTGFAPGADGANESAIDERTADAATMLAGRRVFLVIDRCELLAHRSAPLSVLSTFVEYLPDDARMLLLTRDELGGPFSRLLLQGDLGRMPGDELELDGDESARMLDALGVTEGREPIAEEVAGWVAAMPHVAHATRADGRAGGFHDYLMSAVLGRCEPAERALLLRVSVAGTISRDAVVALCGDDAVADFERLRARHLPGVETATGGVTLHRLFRTFLRDRLQVELPTEVDELRRRNAQLLFDSSGYEAAVGEFLAIGDRDGAGLAAERALPALFERAEWQLIRGWLDEIGDAEVARRPLLTSAHVRSLYGLSEFAEARAVVRCLSNDNRLGDVVAADPGVVPYLGLVYHWQPRDALDLVNQHEGDFRAEALRYELEVLSGRASITPPTGVDWSDMERPMSYGLLMQGRLDQLLEMLPSDADWANPGFYRTPHPLLGLVWRGELDRARNLFDRVPDEMRSRSHVDHWYFHEAWLSWAENDARAMLAAADRAIRASRDARRGAESCMQVVLALALLELGRVDEATTVLEESVARSRRAGLTAYVEWGQTFLGLALLARDRPADAARELQEAFDGMLAAERRLMLPLTGLYLSEAMAQIGEPDSACRAADVAFSEAEKSSSQFVLGQGLRHVPAVLDRSISDDPRSRWRSLLLACPAEAGDSAIVVTDAAPRRVFVEIQTFGDAPDILVDGRPVGARRIKLLELATLLALHPRGLARESVQRRLFPDADPRRGGNYFRQVVHKLRQLTGVGLARTADGLVRWPDDVHVETTDLRLEQLVARARREPPPERLRSFMAALQLMSGPFLRDSDLEWAESRRIELDVLRSELGLESADLALALGDHDLARTLASEVIASDPYVEPAYRVLMSAEAFGSPTTALATYQRLCSALEKLGAEPSPETEDLLREIRS